jgi:hypothetical protein
LEYRGLKDTRNQASVPTKLGRALLGKGGWDPYLEHPTSLWLLHWLLVSEPCMATAWRFSFTHFPLLEFTSERLLTALREYTERSFPTAGVAESSFNKDISCLIRMYAEATTHDVDFSEETLRCPMSELGLIRAADDGRSFAFDAGEKPNLSSAVVVYASLDFAAGIADGARTVSVSRLLLEPGSPGMAFKLSESALCSAIEAVASRTRLVSLGDTAGVLQVSFTRDPRSIATELLNAAFSSRKGA